MAIMLSNFVLVFCEFGTPFAFGFRRELGVDRICVTCFLLPPTR
jgi:hypothetical protein